MSTTITAERVETRTIRRYGENHKLTVTLRLYSLGGQAPHFSATAVETYRGREEGGGAMHDDIVKAFPKFAPVVAVHLSDEHGVPMHAVANMAYWLGYTKYKTASVRYPDGTYKQDEPLPYWPYVCSHWRITEKEAREADNFVRTYVRNGQGTHADALGILALAMAPRWQAEADAALAIIRGEE